MKKLIAIPVMAVIAAVGAASAAGFIGGVSAGPIQSGDASDLTCATSARVVEWGTNDHLNPPNVVNAKIQLTGAHCSGQALHVMSLTPGGTQQHRATSGLIASQPDGIQFARVSFPAGDQPTVAELNAVRITIDPGYAGLLDLPTS
jgi:hypothetical protein